MDGSPLMCVGFKINKIVCLSSKHYTSVYIGHMTFPWIADRGDREGAKKYYFFESIKTGLTKGC